MNTSPFLRNGHFAVLIACVFALWILRAHASLAADPNLDYSRTESGLDFNWTEGSFLLEHATDVSGPWTPVADVASSPSTVPIDDSAQVFFRLRQVVTVTVGIFTNSTSGIVATGQTLVYTVGAECQTWTRTAGPHDSYSTAHLHYNAAKNTTYGKGTLAWTEYGPEHSQAEIDATCAAGVDGVVKTINATDYFEDKGVLLKITKVE